MEDDDLIARIRQGDGEAASQLVERHWEPIFRYLFRLSRNRHDAEDIVQQTFLKVFERLDQYVAHTNFRAWLYRVATNAFLDERRPAAFRVEETPDAATAAPACAPASVAEGRELAQAVEREIMGLPEELRVVVTLRVNEELSHREIAGILKCREGTVRWRFHEARRRLLDALGPYL